MEPLELVLWLATHLVLAILIHEAAHALGGLLVGLRLHAVGLGSPRRAWSLRVFGVGFFVGRDPWTSATTWTAPARMGATRMQLSVMLAAGPGANLALGAALIQLEDPVFRLGGVVHLVLAVANLLPWDLFAASDGLPSDGQRLLAAWRGAELVLAERSTSAAAESAALGFQQMECRPLAARLWALAAELKLDEGDVRGSATAARRARECASELPATAGAALTALAAAMDVAVAGGHEETARQLCQALAQHGKGDLAARARVAAARARMELSVDARAAARYAAAARSLWLQAGNRAAASQAAAVQAQMQWRVDPQKAMATLAQAMKGPQTASTALRVAAMAARLELPGAQQQWQRAMRQLGQRLGILRPVPRAMMLARVRSEVFELSGPSLWPIRVDKDLEHVSVLDARRGRELLRPATLLLVLGLLTVSLSLAQEVEPSVAAASCGLAGGSWMALWLTRHLVRWPRRDRYPLPR